MTSELRYGQIRGGTASFPLPMGASERLNTKSGRFVKRDTSGRGEIAGDTHTMLIGFVEEGDLTCSTTEGATIVKCINDVTGVFRIPLAYDGATWTVNYSTAILEETCDLAVLNSVQYGNCTDSSEDTIVIVGGLAATAVWTDGSVSNACLGDGYLEVMLNPNKMHQVGIGD